MTAPQRPLCRKCLLSDEADQRAYQTIKDYIDSLSPERKVEPSLYRARLENCRACEFLHNALCVKCGCYVEVRCVKSALHCPDVPARW